MLDKVSSITAVEYEELKDVFVFTDTPKTGSSIIIFIKMQNVAVNYRKIDKKIYG